jgi:hypothetical protein
MPWLDHFLAKNPVVQIGPPSFDSAARFCYKQAMTRKADKNRAGTTPDFLDDILAVADNDTGVIISQLLINVSSQPVLGQQLAT